MARPGMSTQVRFGAIDLLRFLAAAAVVLFHYAYRGPANGDVPARFALEWLQPIARYGYLGVHLFFMISGFVIAFSAEGRSARDFAVSRIARLYPAFWLAVAATTLVVHLADARDYAVSWSAVALNLTMFNHLFGVPPVDGVYWSLYVELSFYLLVWVVLLTGNWHRIEFLLAAWLLAALAWQWWPSWRLDQALALQYGPFFVAGAVACRIRMQGSTLVRWALFCVASAGALHLMVGWGPATRIGALEDAGAVAVILCGFFVIFAVLARGGMSGIRGPVVTALGATTYPLYLLHQNIGYVLIDALPPTWPAAWTLALVAACMLGVAHVVARGFEPMTAQALRGVLRPWSTRLLEPARR